jgi:hypothetical protein
VYFSRNLPGFLPAGVETLSLITARSGFVPCFSRNAGRFKASSASFRSLSTAKSFADTVFSRNIIDKSPSQALFCVIFFAWLRLINTQRALLAVIPVKSPILPFSFVASLRLKSPAHPFLAVSHLELNPNSTPETHKKGYISLF